MLEFKYKNLPAFHPTSHKLLGYIVRPIIPIKIKNNDREISCEVLIDSGADHNLIHAELGELINIDIKKGRQGFTEGVSGGKIPTWTHEVMIEVGNINFMANVAFSYDIPKNGTGFVGQDGFFDKFEITFDRSKYDIQLKSV